MMNRETLKTLCHTAEETKSESIRYKTWPHKHLAEEGKKAKTMMMADCDNGLDWTGWCNMLKAIRFEQGRRAAWTV